jgi:hypothetical protein
VIVEQAIVTLYVELVPKQPWASVARIANEYVPPTVGVPAITPVDDVRVKPVGSDPLLILKLYGAVPPLAEFVTPVYVVPNVPFGGDAGEDDTVMVGHTIVTEYA